MLNVALTGNVAAGKSTVLAHFARWGATVIDADQLVRDVQRPGGAVLRAIVDRFGSDMLTPDGALDRARLRRAVMGDEERLGALNAIVHPAVQRLRTQRVERAASDGDCIVVNDIPLLFEVLDPATFDTVVLVDAPVPLRRDRLLRDRGLDPTEADRLINSQMPASQKRARSDHVIDNIGTLADLERVTHRVWSAVRARAARVGVTGERLVMVTAHPDDESYAAGGTAARYGEAGVDVHVVCATSGEGAQRRNSTPADLARSRRTDLQRAAEILGVTAVHQLTFPDGRLRPDDPEGVKAVRDVIASVRPDLVITFGDDGVTGHSDHIAVGRWTRAACHAAGGPSMLFVTYPERIAAALPMPIAGRPEREIAVQLDIRPWGDVKKEAIRAHRSAPAAFDLDAPVTRPLFAREWYAGNDAVEGRRTELFPPSRRA